MRDSKVEGMKLPLNKILCEILFQMMENLKNGQKKVIIIIQTLLS